jgi:D-alanine--poly(phosphoribitol) ligase subunit 1
MKINALDYLYQSVRQYPHRVAVSEKDREVTYVDLWDRAGGLARCLVKAKAGTGGPIAVYLPKSIDAVISFVGILLSGNFYCPLDVKSPAVRTATILANLSPTCVITSQEFVYKLIECGWSADQLVVLDNFVWEHLPECSIPQQIDTDPIYVIYTSGSTGTPKGVTISHRGVIDYIDWARSVYPVVEVDVIGNQAPLFFDNSTLDIYLAFACGATLHLIPEEMFAFPVRLVEYVAKRGVSFIFWVPSVMTLIANTDALQGRELARLRLVLFAGEAMPARTLNYWRGRLPEALYSNLYGPTEVTVDCTYYLVDREITDDELVPIGSPCRNTEILLLDSENRPVVGEDIGELCVRGSSLALGYWNEPEKTAAAFVQNPLRPHYPERIYRTGDLVKRNQFGELVFIGRKDSQIKHHGYRIELGEIEAAASSLSELLAVCVLYNQSKREITLFYEAPVELSLLELRVKLGQMLPKYMLPGGAHWLEKMPLNSNGKIDRVVLASILYSKSKGVER